MPKKTHRLPESSRTAFDVLADRMIDGQEDCIEVSVKCLEVANETHTIMDNVVGTLNREIDDAMRVIKWLVIANMALVGVHAADLVGII